MTLEEALRAFAIRPDVMCEGGSVQWFHRATEGADWYLVTAPAKRQFQGDVLFRNDGEVERWDMRDGSIHKMHASATNGYAKVPLQLHPAEAYFIVFRRSSDSHATPLRHPNEGRTIALDHSWQVAFPNGWGAPARLQTDTLKAWKDLQLGTEGRAFSGTATYTHHLQLDTFNPQAYYVLDLGKVDMIAEVRINGQQAGVLWAAPYVLPISQWLQKGRNEIEIDVTSTWFNRLVYDAALPEAARKTWTIGSPSKDEPLRESGLMGPVVIRY